MSQSEASDFSFSSLEDKEWLNPLSVMELQRAVQFEQTIVELQGKQFKITYHDIAVDDHGIMTGLVFVKIVGNFAPCGWFSINELLRYEFESDHDKQL